MSIDTTINIKLNLLSKIAEVSAIYNISFNRIIAILINKFLGNCSNKAKLFNTIKYQQTGDDIVWHTLHVSFSEDIYEKALDLRKVMKMSVSFIIARAVELYLEQVIKELSQRSKADNYSQDYVFISSKCNGLLCFSIFWSSPSEIILKKFMKNHQDGYIINRKQLDWF